MNRAIASIYAISIGGRRVKDEWAPEVQKKLVEKIPDLIAEIERLEKIAYNPLVQAALEFQKHLVPADSASDARQE